MNGFETAKGSIVGRDHIGSGLLLKGKNNQDAIALIERDELLIGVVCDGCSKGDHSEVGAKLGAKLLSSIIDRRLGRIGDITTPEIAEKFWEQVRQDFLAQIRVTSLTMAGDGSLSDIIAEYFLFTVMAVVMTHSMTQVVCIGDGLYALNEKVVTIEPFSGNYPPYPCYDLIDSLFSDKREMLRFQLLEFTPTKNVQAVLLGTDGCSSFENSASRFLPGKEERLGPLQQFWKEDKFFTNSDSIRRRLALANSSAMRSSSNGSILENGLLLDDTTLIVIRRKREE